MDQDCCNDKENNHNCYQVVVEIIDNNLPQVQSLHVVCYYYYKHSLIQIQMEQRVDHPHHAAVHLMKSLRCCRDCSQIPQSDLRDIHQLQTRRALLLESLKSLQYHPERVKELEVEIQHLEAMITELRIQNEEVKRAGLNQIDRLMVEKEKGGSYQKEKILEELRIEKGLTSELSIELEGLMERVKYLNRINNELMYNFCV